MDNITHLLPRITEWCSPKAWGANSRVLPSLQTLSETVSQNRPRVLQVESDQPLSRFRWKRVYRKLPDPEYPFNAFSALSTRLGTGCAIVTLQFAVTHAYMDILHFVREWGTTPQDLLKHTHDAKDISWLMRSAAFAGRMDAVKFLKAWGFTLAHVRDKCGGVNALHCAIHNGDLDMCRFFKDWRGPEETGSLTVEDACYLDIGGFMLPQPEKHPAVAQFLREWLQEARAAANLPPLPHP